MFPALTDGGAKCQGIRSIITHRECIIYIIIYAVSDLKEVLNHLCIWITTVQLVCLDFIFNVLLAGSGQPGVTGLSGQPGVTGLSGHPGVTGLSGHNGSEVVTS